MSSKNQLKQRVIPNFEKDLKAALVDPLEKFAEKLVKAGFTEEDVCAALTQKEDVIRLKLMNMVRDKIRALNEK